MSRFEGETENYNGRGMATPNPNPTPNINPNPNPNPLTPPCAIPDHASPVVVFRLPFEVAIDEKSSAQTTYLNNHSIRVNTCLHTPRLIELQELEE
ncbi:hypothetical protein DPMN_187340 [Dreissena polymorpha]|uniref:Uncharacterized protein n=1 Tax=Dreissena polymorpha TaxID=45954 RepID=A0A9D4DNU8_DREPO|nr:hypothetical protein DPMN_187340 [Dreissena polymorpha]